MESLRAGGHIVKPVPSEGTIGATSKGSRTYQVTDSPGAAGAGI